MRVCITLLILAAGMRPAGGQALFTGETGGKGSSSLLFSANASFVKDFTAPVNCWTAYTRGIHDRVDAFALYGNLTVLGRTQHYGGIGSNVGILKRSRQGVDVSFLSLLSAPFNHRDRASTAFALLAPLISRPFRIRGYELTLYSGYLRGEPLGRRAGKLFTPPQGTHNGIAGAVLPLSKSLLLIAEYNPGGNQQNAGLALLIVFPRK